MKILHLTIKRNWFDMIYSGDKKHEYREIKMYWATRLANGFQNVYGIDTINPDFKEFDIVRFTNGYTKEALTMDVEFAGIHIGNGLQRWGAEPGKKYYVIVLGNVLLNNVQDAQASVATEAK